MKKRIISMVAILLMAVGTINAQIFMINNDEINLREGEESSELPFIPDLEVTNDQGYTPLGSGALLLAGLAGAYLLAKKKQK